MRSLSGSLIYDFWLVTNDDAVWLSCSRLLETKASSVFVWKRIHFDALRSTVHTNTLSVHRKRMILKLSWKWIETKTHTYRIKVDGRKRSKCIKRWQKISWVRVFVAFAYSSTYLTKCNSIVFERFSVESRKRIKAVVWTRIDRCIFDDNEKCILLKTD